MKKTLTVLIAAGALLGAAACSAPAATNEETCARIQTVGAGPSSSSDKPGMIRLANKLRPIEATASADLRAPLQTFIEFLDESAKDAPDAEKLQKMEASYAAAGETLSNVCAS